MGRTRKQPVYIYIYIYIYATYVVRTLMFKGTIVTLRSPVISPGGWNLSTPYGIALSTAKTKSCCIYVSMKLTNMDYITGFVLPSYRTRVTQTCMLNSTERLYRVIQNECRGFNNLSYTIHLRFLFSFI